MTSRAMVYAPWPSGDEGRKMALEYLRMHRLGQPLPACRFATKNCPPRVGFITSTVRPLNDSKYVKSNSFSLYVSALHPKPRRPTMENNWTNRYEKKVVTCHGGSDEDKMRAAQREIDELGWSIVLPSLNYVVQHSADCDWDPRRGCGRPSRVQTFYPSLALLLLENKR